MMMPAAEEESSAVLVHFQCASAIPRLFMVEEEQEILAKGLIKVKTIKWHMDLDSTNLSFEEQMFQAVYMSW